MNTKLYVGNLPFDSTEANLRDLFSAHGTVTDLHMPSDRATGSPRGFAFVTMDSPSTMQAAIDALHTRAFMGRPLTVNEARPPGDRPAFSGGGGGRRGNGGGGQRRY